MGNMVTIYSPSYSLCTLFLVSVYCLYCYPFLRLSNICNHFNSSTLTAMISYNVVVGDTLSKVLVRFTPNWESSMPSVRMGVVLFVTVSIVIPLCLYKNLSRLARVSFLSLSCIVIILFTVIIKYLFGDYKV